VFEGVLEVARRLAKEFAVDWNRLDFLCLANADEKLASTLSYESDKTTYIWSWVRFRPFAASAEGEAISGVVGS
jgi:hypothetical protein